MTPLDLFGKRDCVALHVNLDKMKRLIKLGQAAGVDGAISTHPIFDGTIAKTVEIRRRKPGDANPWVLGKEKWARYMEADLEVAETVGAMEKEHPVK
jgi:metallo-beta-lactamase class B